MGMVAKLQAWRSSSSVPVHIRSSLLHHGLFSIQDLLRVEDMKKVDGHEEGHREVLPHGVGEVILWINDGVLT